jgi:enterobacterial common antigen polymerase
MSAGDAIMLLAIWVGCVAIIGCLIRRQFLVARFSFNFFFSITYLVTFYLGFPLSVALVFGFAAPIVPSWYLGCALLLPLFSYLVFYAMYTVRLPVSTRTHGPVLIMNRRETTMTGVLLALVAVVTLTAFIAHNGLLFFEVHSYSQAFSPKISGQALKRFAYFLIPAMLIYYFLNPGIQRWWIFLATTAGFGALTYVVVGGTRAYLALAFALFLSIGLADRYIKARLLAPLGVLGVLGMFLLALARYRLDGSGAKQVYNFLFLTRDTLSPWENLALILQRYAIIDFQGPAPIIRDFYVYIPKILWPDRPNLILNTANYFTWHVLGRNPGLTISPTLVGSSFIMGGVLAVVLGGLACGLIIRWFDWLRDSARHSVNQYRDIVVKTFCFGSLFNIIVLVREGLDSFVSRFVFFFVIFALCVLTAKVFCGLVARFDNGPRQIPREKELSR